MERQKSFSLSKGVEFTKENAKLLAIMAFVSFAVYQCKKEDKPSSEDFRQAEKIMEQLGGCQAFNDVRLLAAMVKGAKDPKYGKFDFSETDGLTRMSGSYHSNKGWVEYREFDYETSDQGDVSMDLSDYHYSSSGYTDIGLSYVCDPSNPTASSATITQAGIKRALSSGDVIENYPMVTAHFYPIGEDIDSAYEDQRSNMSEKAKAAVQEVMLASGRCEVLFNDELIGKLVERALVNGYVDMTESSVEGDFGINHRTRFFKYSTSEDGSSLVEIWSSGEGSGNWNVKTRGVGQGCDTGAEEVKSWVYGEGKKREVPTEGLGDEILKSYSEDEGITADQFIESFKAEAD